MCDIKIPMIQTATPARARSTSASNQSGRGEEQGRVTAHAGDRVRRNNRRSLADPERARGEGLEGELHSVQLDLEQCGHGVNGCARNEGAAASRRRTPMG